MSEKLYWSKISTDDMREIKLTYEDFFKLMDCYYGNVFITDGDGYILYLNKWGWNTVGMSREKYLGKHVTDLVKDGVFQYSVTMEVLKTKQITDMEAVDIDGKKFWVHAVPVFDDNDNILFTVHYSQYEREISKFLAEIEQSKALINQMKGLLEHYSETIGGAPLIYRSETMDQVLHYARKVAKTDCSFLFVGESVTGKELVSHYIYDRSERREEVFLLINCAATPRELIESELFGYAPGAFTGASKNGKIGAFELADKGTLFLDEVGEIPIRVQAKLLRVLESGEITRVGTAKAKKVDVRIIAATNRDLETMVREGNFRGDLYYRLNVLPLTIPPLRSRPEDIALLADHYLKEFNNKYHTNKRFSEACVNELVCYRWPGNVRELKNLVHRMVIATDQQILDRPKLDLEPQARKVSVQGPQIQLESDLKTAMRRFELEYINQAISASKGNVTKAAELLGVHRTYIYRKLRGQSGGSET